MVVKSNKEILNAFASKLKDELPDMYDIYRECIMVNRNEFRSMIHFADRIGAPKPIIGKGMREYLNKIWPYIERYKP